jgi:hypothetical protein
MIAELNPEGDMKPWKLKESTRAFWLPAAALLLGAALPLAGQMARRWVRHHAEAMSAAVFHNPFTAHEQMRAIQAVPLTFTFTVRNYGGKCLEFGAAHPLPHQTTLGQPVFISDCNGSVAQQVRVEEVNNRHEVILRMGNGVIGRNETPVIILQTASAARDNDSAFAQASPAAPMLTSAADQIPLEVQSYTGSAGQIFALDGDSIILAADRNLVVEVQNHRGANGTPLVLGRRDLDDSEFWTFTATDGSAKRPTNGFVRISQTDNSADGELRARADFLYAVFGAKWGTVIELDPNVSLNLADTPSLPIPAGVTIRGDRRGTRPGPLLAARNQQDQPSSSNFPGLDGGMLFINGDHVRITGLRMQGPSRSIIKGVPYANAVAAPDQYISTIDHNEMFDWTAAAVYVPGAVAGGNVHDHRPPSSRPQNVRVVRNFLHHNHMWSSGYGVVTYSGYPSIEGNTFLSNRHAIAASNDGFTGYTAWFNLALSAAPDYSSLGYSHTPDFDMHGTLDEGCQYCGGDAGWYAKIARNTFLGTNRANFTLRGTPGYLAEFSYNISLESSWDALLIRGEDTSKKLTAVGNQFNAPNPTGRLGVGDFDGDGKEDLFLATGAAWYYAPAGIAEWRFLNAQTDKMGTLLFGDFDGDGRTDVFTQHGRNWDVSWGGASQWEKINESNPALSDFAVGDFDGNHRADIFYSDGHDWFVSYGGVGMFQPLNTSVYRVPNLRFGDFDGDGKTDVFTVGYHWQVSYGGTSVWQPLPHKLTGTVANLIVADFNGDGRADVATPSPDSPTSWVWKISYGGVSDWTQASLPRNSIAAIGRFDGRTGADLLLWNGDDALEIDSGGLGTSRPHSRQDMR